MDEAPAVHPPRPAATRPRAWLIAALVFVILRSLPDLSYPIGRDQSTYCWIGQRLLFGEHLYQDLWDNKPPGIFYIYALIVKVFGPVMWCVGVVDVLWVVLISCCIFRFARRYVGPAGAAVAVAFNAAWHAESGYIHAAQPETFLMLFVFAAYFLVEREVPGPRLLHFAAGLLFGAAFWLKYNALAFLPLLVLVPYLDPAKLDAAPHRLGLNVPWRCWLTRVGILIAGAGTAVGVVLAYFWITGSWPALMEVQFEVLPRYGEMALGRTPHYWLFLLYRTGATLGFWTLAATAVGLAAAWKRRELGRFLPVFLAALMGYASTALQVRLHPYSFETCFPVFAVVWGYVGITTYLAFRVLASRCAAHGWRLARALVWVVFATVLTWLLPAETIDVWTHYKAMGDWWRNQNQFYADYPWPDGLEHFRGQLDVVSYLRMNSAPGDQVFVWGTQPLIYFLAQRRPPTRFVSNLALISPWGPPRWREELVRTLDTSPPRFIVVARHDGIPTISYTTLDSEQYLGVYPSLANFISQNYQRVVNLADFAIYRR